MAGQDERRATFLANVGQKDMRYKGRILLPKSLRQESENLLNDDTTWDDIAVPMLLSALRDALSDVNKLDPLVLFGTDQTDEEFRHGDTIHCAKIIKSLVPRYYGKSGSERVRAVGNIYVQPIRKQPNLYDSMMEEYDKHLRKLMAKFIPDDGPVYVLCSGGTPQCNTALLFRSVELFGDRCIVLYVSEDGTPYRLDLPEQLLGTYRRATACELLRRWDFKGIAALEGLDDEVQLLAEYADCRIRFDFESARRSADALTKLVGSPRRPFYARLRRDLDVLSHAEEDNRLERDMARLHELADAAKVAFLRGEYVYYVGILRRFCEATYHYVVLKYTGIDCDSLRGDEIFVKKLKELGLCEPVVKRLAGAGMQRVGLNMPTFEAVLGSLADNGGALRRPRLSDGDRNRIRTVNGILAGMTHLNELRNRSILAHGYEGVSSEDLVIRCGGEQSEAIACTALETLTGISRKSVYTEIWDYIGDMLRQAQ